MFGLLPLLGPHLPIVVGSTAFFFAAQAVSPWLSGKLLPATFARFDGRTKRNWATKINSMIHALTILPLAVSVMNKPSLQADPVFGYDHGVGNVLALSCGYFIWDTVDSIRHSTIGFVVHGLSCFAVYMFSFRPFLASFGPRFLLWELSTPFLNIHWFMEKLNLDKRYPNLNFLNDVLFAVAFFVARIVFGSYHSYLFFQAVYTERHRIPTYLLIIYGVGNVALNSLNWLWFSKIIGKLLQSAKPPKKPSQRDTDGHPENELRAMPEPMGWT